MQSGRFGKFSLRQFLVVFTVFLITPSLCAPFFQDIFHLQITSGNLTANIERYLPYTGGSNGP